MVHSHRTGTGLGQGPRMGLGCNVHIAQGQGLGMRPGNIMHATEIHYKVLQGNISGPEKWVGNPLTNFQVGYETSNACYLASGGSKGGAGDARPPLGIFFSFSCSFQEKLGKQYVGAPPGVGAPPSGKS